MNCTTVIECAQPPCVCQPPCVYCPLTRDWLKHVSKFEWQFFYASAEQALGLLFAMSTRPEVQAEAVVKHMARRLFHVRAAHSSVTVLCVQLALHSHQVTRLAAF